MLDSVLVDVFVTGSCGVGCGWLVWVVCLCGLVVAGSVGVVVFWESFWAFCVFNTCKSNGLCLAVCWVGLVANG